MFTESLTPRPELENDQDPKQTLRCKHVWISGIGARSIFDDFFFVAAKWKRCTPLGHYHLWPNPSFHRKLRIGLAQGKFVRSPHHGFACHQFDPPQLEDSAFVAVTDAASLAEILCIEQERIVARDNTVTYDGRNLQLPESRARAHYVKARVKVREYPDGTLAVFHGPRLLARYNATGQTIEGEPERLKTAA